MEVEAHSRLPAAPVQRLYPDAASAAGRHGERWVNMDTDLNAWLVESKDYWKKLRVNKAELRAVEVELQNLIDQEERAIKRQRQQEGRLFQYSWDKYPDTTSLKGFQYLKKVIAAIHPGNCYLALPSMYNVQQPTFRYEDVPLPRWVKEVTVRKGDCIMSYIPPDTGKRIKNRTELLAYKGKDGQLVKQQLLLFQFPQQPQQQAPQPPQQLLQQQHQIYCICHTQNVDGLSSGDKVQWRECAFGRAGCNGKFHEACAGLGTIEPALLEGEQVVCPLCSHYLDGMGCGPESYSPGLRLLRNFAFTPKRCLTLVPAWQQPGPPSVATGANPPVPAASASSAASAASAAPAAPSVSTAAAAPKAPVQAGGTNTTSSSSSGSGESESAHLPPLEIEEFKSPHEVWGIADTEACLRTEAIHNQASEMPPMPPSKGTVAALSLACKVGVAIGAGKLDRDYYRQRRKERERNNGVLVTSDNGNGMSRLRMDKRALSDSLASRALTYGEPTPLRLPEADGKGMVHLEHALLRVVNAPEVLTIASGPAVSSSCRAAEVINSSATGSISSTSSNNKSKSKGKSSGKEAGFCLDCGHLYISAPDPSQMEEDWEEIEAVLSESIVAKANSIVSVAAERAMKELMELQGRLEEDITKDREKEIAAEEAEMAPPPQPRKRSRSKAKPVNPNDPPKASKPPSKRHKPPIDPRSTKRWKNLPEADRSLRSKEKMYEDSDM